MKQNFWCKMFNLHKFEVYKETPIKDRHDNQIGIAIVSRCSNCGKVKSIKVYTEESYER